MLGYQSAVVNGQLVNVAPKAGYDPIIFGQAYTPSQSWLRQGVYNVPPVLPSGALQSSAAPQSYGMYGSMGFEGPTANDASGSPYSMKRSPLWMALLFLAAGILMIQHIHYR